MTYQLIFGLQRAIWAEELVDKSTIHRINPMGAPEAAPGSPPCGRCTRPTAGGRRHRYRRTSAFPAPSSRGGRSRPIWPSPGWDAVPRRFHDQIHERQLRAADAQFVEPIRLCRQELARQPQQVVCDVCPTAGSRRVGHPVASRLRDMNACTCANARAGQMVDLSTNFRAWIGKKRRGNWLISQPTAGHGVATHGGADGTCPGAHSRWPFGRALYTGATTAMATSTATTTATATAAA